MIEGVFIGFGIGAFFGWLIGSHDSDSMYRYEQGQHWRWFDKYIEAVTERRGTSRPTLP